MDLNSIRADMAAPLAPSQIPSVDRVLSLPAVQALAQAHGRALVTAAVRTSLSDLRAQAEAGVLSASEIEHIAERVHARVGAALTPVLRAVHNLTGTVLHTNLGRALLPPHALDGLQLVLTQACNLEYDLESGARGDRDDLIVPLLRQLTGAPAATVVNNNAAATLIALSSLAKNKEVIVSRGELVEIGASYRIPEIMASAGCRLREVGTTNRTHLTDYQNAIGPKTAALLKVHTSNYRVEGYTAAPEERELAELAHRHQLPYVVDLGSGALIDMKRLGLPHEPTVQEALRAGADLVTFSGDKLLGGPQAGLILGRADLIARIKKNPLKRALRVDKLTLACLESVLRLYLDPDRLAHSLPTLRLLLRPQAQIKAQAERLAPALRSALGAQYRLEIAECMSQIGSGALPVDTLPSAALRIMPTAGKGVGAALSRLERALRALPTPVIGRVQDDALWLDLRCLGDEAGLLAELPQLRLSPPPSRPSP